MLQTFSENSYNVFEIAGTKFCLVKIWPFLQLSFADVYKFHCFYFHQKESFTLQNGCMESLF